MKKQSCIRFASIGFCLSFALALGYAPAASAQEDIETSQDCNVQILQGSYGYSFSGFSGPFATTTSFFSGAGNLRRGGGPYGSRYPWQEQHARKNWARKNYEQHD